MASFDLPRDHVFPENAVASAAICQLFRSRALRKRCPFCDARPALRKARTACTHPSEHVPTPTHCHIGMYTLPVALARSSPSAGLLLPSSWLPFSPVDGGGAPPGALQCARCEVSCCEEAACAAAAARLHHQSADHEVTLVAAPPPPALAADAADAALAALRGTTGSVVMRHGHVGDGAGRAVGSPQNGHSASSFPVGDVRRPPGRFTSQSDLLELEYGSPPPSLALAVGCAPLFKQSGCRASGLARVSRGGPRSLHTRSSLTHLPPHISLRLTVPPCLIAAVAT